MREGQPISDKGNRQVSLAILHSTDVYLGQNRCYKYGQHDGP
jgi:hypothetical protein